MKVKLRARRKFVGIIKLFLSFVKVETFNENVKNLDLAFFAVHNYFDFYACK